MNPSELTWILLVSGALLVLAVYFGRRQIQILRGLRTLSASEEDRRSFRRQAARRLFCSGLMVVLAALMLGTIFFDAENREREHRLQERRQQDDTAQREDKQFVRFFAGYVIVLVLVLFVLLAVAAVDFWAVTRHGLRQHRRLQADHRAQLESELQQLRHNRNGEG